MEIKLNILGARLLVLLFFILKGDFLNNIYNIWFARVEVANSVKAKLYKNFSTEEIFHFTEEDFIKQGVQSVSIEKFLDENYKLNLEKYQEYMNKNSIKQIFKDDDKYPDSLKIIQDAPTYIFTKRKNRFNV